MIHAVTHDGEAYADDIMAAAILKIASEGQIKISRTRNYSTLRKADIVFDIGGEWDPKKGRFDHRQSHPPKRKNGFTYATAGLLWKEHARECIENILIERGYENGSFFIEYFETIVPHMIRFIEKQLFQHLDIVDNDEGDYLLVNHRHIPGSLQVGNPCKNQFAHPNQKPYTFAKYLKSLSKSWWQTEEDENEWFFDAVETAEDMLKDLIEDTFWYQKARRTVINKILEAQGTEFASVLVLDQLMPYKFFKDHELRKAADVQFVVYPATSSSVATWKLVGVVDPDKSSMVKIPLPASWAGLAGGQLQKQSNCPQILSCANNLSFAIFKTQEAAIHVAKSLVDHKRLTARTPFEPINLN